ncbi:MAG: type II toxin-antitoxin system PemK/MazF family toxin [Candidatus Ozemobacteraceae bacterium]
MINKQILRGEIWLINFDPTVGAEIQKTRPGLVISSNSLGILPLRLIAPITAWKTDFENNIWHIRISPEKANGLQKESAIDLIQIRSLDRERFIKRLGRVSGEILKESVYALLSVVDYASE